MNSAERTESILVPVGSANDPEHDGQVHKPVRILLEAGLMEHAVTAAPATENMIAIALVDDFVM